MLTLICSLIMFAEPTVSLTSEQHTSLFVYSTPAWCHWHYRDGVWYFMIDSDRSEDRGITIYKWPDGGELEEIAHATARERLVSVRASAVSEDGSLIYVKDLSNPRIFKVNSVESEFPFQRVYSKDLTDSLVFWQDKAFAGINHPQNEIVALDQSDLNHEDIEFVNRFLFDDTYHPVQEGANFNPMILAADGAALAVGYGLYDKVLIVHGRQKKIVELRFPGRIEPPNDFRPPKSRDDGFLVWLDSFHRLAKLKWFQGELYGLFRRGFHDLGVWVALTGDSDFAYENKNHVDEQLISLEGNSVIFGRKIENSNGDLSWQLWRSSTLPSP